MMASEPSLILIKNLKSQKSQRLLDSSGKMKNFQNFSRVRPKSKFCTDETKKPTVDDVKI